MLFYLCKILHINIIFFLYKAYLNKELFTVIIKILKLIITFTRKHLININYFINELCLLRVSILVKFKADNTENDVSRISHLP